MRPLVPLLILGLAVAGPATGRRAPQSEDGVRAAAEYRDETARARALRAEADTARREIIRLDSRLAALDRETTADDVTVRAQRARLAELNAREAALVGRLSATRGRLSRLLSALQMMSRRPPPALLIPADKAVDTVRAAVLMQAMQPALARETQGLSDRQAEILRVRRLAALSSERLFTMESQSGDRRAEMEGLRGRKVRLLAVLQAEAGRAEVAARRLEARIRELGGTPPPTPRADDSSADALPGGRQSLTAPVDGPPSERFSRRAQGWRWPVDGPVRAPADAEVEYAGPVSGWGGVVILDLGPGWRVVVAGLDTFSVEAGDRIEDGAPLGRADGEVYFELRRRDRPIDPAPWLS